MTKPAKQSLNQDTIIQAASEIAGSIFRLANAIAPNICGGAGANGGHVESITEAVMDASTSLLKIANAIELLDGTLGRIADSAESLEVSVSNIPGAIESLENSIDAERS